MENKPSCPDCKSEAVYFRLWRKNFICRRCGKTFGLDVDLADTRRNRIFSVAAALKPEEKFSFSKPTEISALKNDLLGIVADLQTLEKEL
ncbi:MAG: hypothetical protein A2Z83_07540 [Omnitrophica bacterium GWA2_52_8]|nr:MAG: hypothetical protein A2Z83_07540 [Omnitrophica bacterium GWA2_52_8]